MSLLKQKASPYSSLPIVLILLRDTFSKSCCLYFQNASQIGSFATCIFFIAQQNGLLPFFSTFILASNKCVLLNLSVNIMQETWVWSLDWEDPLKQEMANCSSILAWRISWTEEPGGLQSTGSQETDMTEYVCT